MLLCNCSINPALPAFSREVSQKDAAIHLQLLHKECAFYMVGGHSLRGTETCSKQMNHVIHQLFTSTNLKTMKMAEDNHAVDGQKTRCAPFKGLTSSTLEGLLTFNRFNQKTPQNGLWNTKQCVLSPLSEAQKQRLVEDISTNVSFSPLGLAFGTQHVLDNVAVV